MTFGIFAFAQKEYVNVYAELHRSSDDDIYVNGFWRKIWYDNVYLSGAIPSTMKKVYNAGDDKTTIGDVINMLVKEGFVVEQMAVSGGGSSTSYFQECVLLSRNSSNTPSAIQRVQTSLTMKSLKSQDTTFREYLSARVKRAFRLSFIPTIQQRPL